MMFSTGSHPSLAVTLYCLLLLPMIVVLASTASHHHHHQQQQQQVRSALMRRLTERELERNHDISKRQTSDDTQQRVRQRADPSGFLERFGYLPPIPSGQGHDHASRRHAIRQFQKMYHIEETGEMDEPTLMAMDMPRCGMPDLTPLEFTSSESATEQQQLQPQNFFVPGYKWSRTDLSYHIRNFATTSSVEPTAQRRAIERAFQLWSEVSPLTFRETAEETGADFNLEFVAYEHRDGPQNAFDGPGGVLAHAFYPQSGETHFDLLEPWVDRESEGIDLTTVTAHELGHALGLGHSEVAGALMAPYYQGYDPDFTLPQDDQQAIQSLYGSDESGPATRPTAASTTPTTTTTTWSPYTTPPGGEYPESCSVAFRAATQAYDGSIHVFNGARLWRLTEDNGLDSPGYPVITRTVYEYSPSTVDAAVYSTRTFHTYLFRGDKVWKYYGFRLLGGRTFDTTGHAANVMSAITDKTGTIYLLKGITCWEFDESTLRVNRQSRMCLQLFPNAPINMDSALRLSSQPDIVYFFRGPYYYKYRESSDGGTSAIEPGYPKLKAAPWIGTSCGRYTPK